MSSSAAKFEREPDLVCHVRQTVQSAVDLAREDVSSGTTLVARSAGQTGQFVAPE